MNLNTVLAAVSWELTEPEEGKFDFTLVDGLIDDARQYNLRLVLLWFGSWKNGESSYTPYWVKTDRNRFPVVQNAEGKALGILSPLGRSSCDADARAFAALMWHIRQVDSGHNTVIGSRWRTSAACWVTRATARPPRTRPSASRFRGS